MSVRNTLKSGIAATALAAVFALVSAPGAQAGTMTIMCPTTSGNSGSVTVDCTVPPFPGGQSIIDLDVEVGIDTSWASELNISLSHNGTTVLLVDVSLNNLSIFSNVDITFDDSAPGGISGNVGTFQPDGPGTLADFNGQGFAGLWQLIVDDVFIDDPQDVVKFNLIAQITEVPEPTSLALFAGGLFAAGASYRRRQRAAPKP